MAELLNSFLTPSASVYHLLLYWLVTAALNRMIPGKLRSWYLLGVSVLFYALSDVSFLWVLAVETLAAYLLARKIDILKHSDEDLTGTFSDKPGREKGSGSRTGTAHAAHIRMHCCLISGIGITIAFLGFFKFRGVFAGFLKLSSENWILPLGISYYSFKIISYLADVYKGKIPAEKDPVCFALYVLLFTEILSGPISRADEILPQIRGLAVCGHEKDTDELNATLQTESGTVSGKPSGEAMNSQGSLYAEGLILLISGMFKKAVIADRITVYTKAVFAAPSTFPALALWIGAVLYSIQLYCDFAGYSEIAMGMSAFLGIRIRPNFLRPYLASDIVDFWRRWHISLSSWLRDYIYIPLGGNRKGRGRKFCNILVTFAVCGIWHGAGLTFLLWGVYHGALNLLLRGGRKAEGAARFVMRILTLVSVGFGWILFRADSFRTFADYITGMFRNMSLSYQNIAASVLPFTSDLSSAAYAVTLAVFIAILYWYESLEERNHGERVRRVLIYCMLLLVLLFGRLGVSSFLYAAF